MNAAGGGMLQIFEEILMWEMGHLLRGFFGDSLGILWVDQCGNWPSVEDFFYGLEDMSVKLTFCLMSRTRRSSDVPAAVVGRTAPTPPTPPPPPLRRSNFTGAKSICGALRLSSRGLPQPLNTFDWKWKRRRRRRRATNQ